MSLTCRLALLLVAPSVLRAQQPDTVPTLDPVTVTAERRPVSRPTAPTRTVERADIVRRAPADLTQVLRDLPGIQLDPVVGSGLGVSMQGLGSDRVLVLLDGAPLTGRIANDFDLSRMSPGLVERIEIVEGPQSTLYGSSALGGVINLISRVPRPGSEVRAQVASHGQRDLGARWSDIVGASPLSLDVGHRNVDLVPGQGPASVGGAERWDGMARWLTTVGSAPLDVRAIVVHDAQRYHTGSASAPEQANNVNTQVDLLLTHQRGATEFRVHGSSYHHDLVTEGVLTGARKEEPQVQRLADVEVLHRVAPVGVAMLVGARGEWEQVTSDRLADGEQVRRAVAAFATAERGIAPWLTIRAGARATAAEVWGTHVTPRAGAVAASGPWYASVAIARGFRAPSFLEQFADYVNTGRGNYVIRGNTDLVPETSWNLTGEVGARTRTARMHVRGFGNELRDFIETAQVGTDAGLPVFTYRNVGEARTRGVEVGGAIAGQGLELDASYAWVDATNRETGEPLFGVARHTARAGLAVARGRWRLEGDVVRSSAVPLGVDRATGGTLAQGAWPRANVRGSLDVGTTLTVHAGVDNVTDVVPAGATSSNGRRLFAGLTWGGAR